MINFNFSEFPELENDRIQLVHIQEENAADLFEIFSNPKVLEFYNLLPVKNIEEAKDIIQWFQARFEEMQGIRWGIKLKSSKQLIGTIGLSKIIANHKATLGYDLNEKFWNKGIITEVLDIVCSFGFEFMNLKRIDAEVMVGNLASEKVLIKNGFLLEGKLEKWLYWDEAYYDMLMYAKTV